MRFSVALSVLKSGIVISTLLFLIAPLQTHAQFTQQGDRFSGTGAVGFAQQGRSVSLSSDGNTLIYGGIGDNNYLGAAWVWTRSGGVWTQQGSKLVGTGAVTSPIPTNQGNSVSISADGNTAIVGGPSDNSQVGAAWVYLRSGGVWTQQGNKLVGSGATGSATQGASVSLSSDGNTAIIGGEGDNGGAGAAWVYTRSGGVWTQQGSKLVGTGAVGLGSYQGHSIDLSADGNTAIVGGNGDNSSAGAAWVYTRSGGVWTQQGSKLVGTGTIGTTAVQQGNSVSLSADGNTAIVGGNGDNNRVGAAWVFTRSGGVWTQQGNKLVGMGAVGASSQGQSVALSGDGNTAVVGGQQDSDGVGATWVWTRSGNVWTQLGSKLVGSSSGPGGSGRANQGFSVSISSDGNTVIEGGFAWSNLGGAVWAFTRTGSSVFPQAFGAQRLNIMNGKFLRFGLPQKEQVMIRLFNSQGRIITRLLDETREAGDYTVPLSNEAQGAYFLDFRAGDYNRTMKTR